MNPIRVLIVEDSAVMRRALREIIESDPGMEVLDTARDGDEGVRKARELRPDVVTMDVNLPGMDGITAMQMILNEDICPVLIISSFTGEGDVTTFQALELGAFDCIFKPQAMGNNVLEETRDQILKKIRAAAGTGILEKIRNRVRRSTSENLKRQSVPDFTRKRTAGSAKVIAPVTPHIAVAIGVSTGGPGLLSDLIHEIPGNLGATVFIVQHMPERFTGQFAERLDARSALQVFETEHSMPVFENCAYLARGGRHLVLHRKKDDSITIRLAQFPDHLFKPSVDVMMDSVVSIFGRNTIGVLLTGMGNDGAYGMKLIREAGGYTIAESEETAVVFGMPRAAIEAGVVTQIEPSYRIAESIISVVSFMKERMEKVHGRENTESHPGP